MVDVPAPRSRWPGCTGEAAAPLDLEARSTSSAAGWPASRRTSTCSYCSCTTSSPTAGRPACSPTSCPGSTRSRPALPRTPPPVPASRRTTRLGNAPGSTVRVLDASSASGATRWPTCPPSTSLPTGPGPPGRRERRAHGAAPAVTALPPPRYAATHHLSFLAVLQAGLLTVLHRYTGQDDLPIGSVFSGRTRTEIAPLVGFFANTLVLRTDLDGDPTFTELVRRCHDTVVDATAHQDAPFGLVVDTLVPEGSRQQPAVPDQPDAAARRGRPGRSRARRRHRGARRVGAREPASISP